MKITCQQLASEFQEITKSVNFYVNKIKQINDNPTQTKKIKADYKKLNPKIENIYKSLSLLPLTRFQPVKKFRNLSSFTRVRSATINPDNDCFITTSANETIYNYKLSNYKRNILFKNDTKEYFQDIKFSPGGQILALVSKNKIHLIDSKTNSHINTFVSNISFETINYNHDGTLFVTIGIDQQGHTIVSIWDALKFKPIYDVNPNKINTITKAIFHPNNKQLIVSTTDQKISVYDIKTNKIIKNIGSHNNDINTLQFSPNGQYFLYSRYNEEHQILYTSNYQPHTTINDNSGIRDIFFSKDSKFLLTENVFFQYINIWDIDTGKNIHQINTKSKNKMGFSLSHDNQTLITLDLYNLTIWSNQPEKFKTNLISRTLQVLIKIIRGK